MNKKIMKITSVLLMVMFIFSCVSTIFAAGAVDPSQIQAVETDTSKLQNIGGQIITIISTLGSIVSVIILIILGLKYMMGSAEEKAEYKKTLLPYVVGAGLVFAASSIAGVIFSFTQGIGQ